MPDRAKQIIAGLLGLLLCLLAWDFLYWTGRFPPSCYIEKLDVSGLSKYEALKKLKAVDVDGVILDKIELRLNGRLLAFRPSELGIYISPRRTVSNTDSSTYRSNYAIDLIRRATNGYSKRVLPLALDVEPEIFKAIIKGIAGDFDEPSRESTFVLKEDGKYKITYENVGRYIDTEASLSELRRELFNNARESDIIVGLSYPRVYSNDLFRYPPKYLLAEYTTYYGSHDSPNRVYNIKLASSRTNNYVMVSGEVFSLLSALGDFTRDSGYKEAFVLYNGELEPQFGGGSCQIASTLYNAALLSGLDIVERHNHGIYFTIYPLGRDASIYSGSRDLRFMNNTLHPVYIKAFATDRKLTYRIYGTPTGKKVQISRPMIFFEGEEFIAYDVSSDEAKARINEALLNGKPYYTYVKIFTNRAGYPSERTIWSHYNMTGDRENVRIVRPEPE